MNELILTSSSQLAESVAKLLVKEKKRRKGFQEDVLGLLPWPVEGLSGYGGEGTPMGPSLDITARGGGEGLVAWKIGRSNVEELFATIEGLARDSAETTEEGQESPLLKTKDRLEDLLGKMDTSVEDLKVIMSKEKKRDSLPAHCELLDLVNLRSLD